MGYTINISINSAAKPSEIKAQVEAAVAQLTGAKPIVSTKIMKSSK